MTRTTRKEYLNREFRKAIEASIGPSDMTEEERAEFARRRKTRDIIRKESLEML